jgi:hypothetical protein
MEPIEGTAHDLLDEAEAKLDEVTPGKTDQAKSFLITALSIGERAQNDIKKEAFEAGISWWTLRIAAKDIVLKRKVGLSGWSWRLK